MNPRYFSLGIVGIIGMILLSLQLLYAQDYKLQPFVNDYANLLTPGQEASLDSVCRLIEQNSSYEVVIVTVPDTDGRDRVSYAAQLGEDAGVGKSAADNGIVVLWSVDNEKGLAFATGRGAEALFNDAKAGRILRDNRHYFDTGNYSDGFQGILTAIQTELGMATTNTTADTTTGVSDWDITTWIVVIGAIIFVIWLLSKLGSGFGSGLAVGSILSSGGRGGGGGGGFSFGGGSFSSGGARG